MARIQILPLPPVKVGEFEQTPFAVILDQFDAGTNLDTAELREHLNAVAVITSTGTLDVVVPQTGVEHQEPVRVTNHINVSETTDPQAVADALQREMR